MKSFTGALALGLSLGLAPFALADGGVQAPVQGPVHQIDGDDDAALTAIEKQLDDLLLVDESGTIVLREEFLAMLPEDVPAARIQVMLGALVELDPEGHFKFRNREMMRPYLPMLRNFLEQGGTDKLKGMQDLSPEQREEALRDMMEGRGPAPAPAPQRRQDSLQGRGAQPAPNQGALERRVVELEERLAILERALGDQAEGRAQPRERGAGRLLGRMGDMGRRVRVWGDGLRKLGELMTPEDFEQLRDMIQKMELGPEDLRAPEGLMSKLQQGMDPLAMGRFLEIFSNFIATPEGRAMVEEVERTVAQLEAFVNSPQGRRLGDAFQQLQSRGKGEQQGGSGGIMRRLEDLMQGRDKRDRSAEDHRRARPRRHAEGGSSGQPQPAPGVNPPAGSKLY